MGRWLDEDPPRPNPRLEYNVYVDPLKPNGVFVEPGPNEPAWFHGAVWFLRGRSHRTSNENRYIVTTLREPYLRIFT